MPPLPTRTHVIIIALNTYYENEPRVVVVVVARSRSVVLARSLPEKAPRANAHTPFARLCATSTTTPLETA